MKFGKTHSTGLFPITVWASIALQKAIAYLCKGDTTSVLTEKNIYKLPLWSLVIWALVNPLFSAGCATSAKMERGPLITADAIQRVESSKSVSFYRLLFNVTNTRIGAHHDGLMRVPQFEHYWSSGQFFGGDQFKAVVTDVLRRYNYNVLGMESPLFGRDNSSKAQFHIGAKISDVKYNTYAPLAGNFSESEIVVEWQVLDAYSKNVVLQETFTGYGRSSGITNNCIMDAFVDAFKKMMVHSSFTEMLASQTSLDSPPTYQEKLLISSPSLPLRELPRDINEIMHSIVFVKVGATHGSGVVISPDGYVLTSEHVVSGTNEVMVIFFNKTQATARVVRADANQDIALLKMDVQNLPYLPVKDDIEHLVGDDVFVIGNPMDESLSFTVSKGILSAIRHDSDRNVDWLQTDASLNPGNSGGPMMDQNGNILGIVAWKWSLQEGISFAACIKSINERLGIKVLR